MLVQAQNAEAEQDETSRLNRHPAGSGKCQAITLAVHIDVLYTPLLSTHQLNDLPATTLLTM